MSSSVCDAALDFSMRHKLSTRYVSYLKLSHVKYISNGELHNVYRCSAQQRCSRLSVSCVSYVSAGAWKYFTHRPSNFNGRNFHMLCVHGDTKKYSNCGSSIALCSLHTHTLMESSFVLFSTDIVCTHRILRNLLFHCYVRTHQIIILNAIVNGNLRSCGCLCVTHHTHIHKVKSVEFSVNLSLSYGCTVYRYIIRQFTANSKS